MSPKIGIWSRATGPTCILTLPNSETKTRNYSDPVEVIMILAPFEGTPKTVF